MLPLIYIIDDEEDIINLIILEFMLPNESGFEIGKYQKKERTIPCLIIKS